MQGFGGQTSGYPRHQHAVWEGVSISSITLMPRNRAYSTTSATSNRVYRSLAEYAPIPCNRGKDRTSSGKDWSSTTCQCSTFNLAYDIESSSRLSIVSVW
jgi:hypothetical protein